MLEKDFSNLIIEIAGETIDGLTETFALAKPGDLIATIDSLGALAISIVNGSAARKLNADSGTPLEIIFSTKE
jgi:S-adenosylmethionine hydrolase